ncbi:MAG TPA: mannosyltransferase family protein [Bacillota bacterium]|nr:mannosyltransferase family protein [Bacillota bacterium]
MKKTPWHNLILIYSVHLIAVLSSDYFGQNIRAGRKAAPLPFWDTTLNGLSNWDGRWYLTIAENGYDPKSAAFFPLYPALIAFCKWLGIDPVIGGAIIANLAFFGLLIGLYHLASLDFSEPVVLRAIWYLALFPTAFYFSTLYTESLFLLLVVYSLYWARRQKWWPCCLAAGLATLTRSLGVFLLIPLLYEYRQGTKEAFTQQTGRITALIPFALIPAGLLSFMGYLSRTLSSPLAFMTAQQYWKRHPDFPWSSIIKTGLYITQGNNLFNMIFTLVAIVLVIWGTFYLRLSYSLFAALGLLIPLCSPASHSPLLSMPRFVLVLFPIYLVMALLIRREQIHYAVLTLFTMALCYLTILFANSRWVA